MSMVRSLAERLREDPIIVAPGVYDGFSAKLADRLGFAALYMTGYGVAGSRFARPDAGLVTYTEMVAAVEMIAEATSTPLIADADTGFGGLLNVRQTVRGYEAAGAAAIQIEDQQLPKKCGHTLGRQVVPTEEMVTKIKVAIDSRRKDETLIVARTDARTSLGLDEALRRATAYSEAGAQVIFVESPESEDELGRIGREIAAPLLANMVPRGGRTPAVGSSRLQAMGFDVAIFPAVGFAAAAAALDRAFRHLHDRGEAPEIDASTADGLNLHALLGFVDVWEFETRWGRGAG